MLYLPSEDSSDRVYHYYMATIEFLQLGYFPTRNLKIFKFDCARNPKETGYFSSDRLW